MQKSNELWPRLGNAFYIITGIASLMAMYVSGDPYKNYPDFSVLILMNQIAAAISLLGLVIYYKLREKSNSYYWINAALIYYWLILIVKISFNHDWLPALYPDYFLLSNNLMGNALTYFNILIAIPGILYLILALARYLSELKSEPKPLGIKRTAIFSASVIMTQCVLISLFLLIVSGKVMPGPLSTSYAEGHIIQAGTDENEIASLTIGLSNNRYSYDEIYLSFVADSNIQIAESGQNIPFTALREGQHVKVTYKFNFDAENQMLKMDVIN